jgi:GNAT superfamily N-acetyltransferase
MSLTIQQASTQTDFLKCRRAIQTLRPGLTNDLYEEAVRQTLADNRIMVFIEEDNEAAAVGVFEYGCNLFRGKYIYIDDLSTLPEYRGKGYAGQLVDWILEYAQKEGYNEVHLDSGVSEARTDAHRLYLNKRFKVTSLHFVNKL